MRRSRALGLLLFLALFIIGTVVVISTTAYYLALSPQAFLSSIEVPVLGRQNRWNATDHGKTERVPRIIHQTWKDSNLPAVWRKTSQGCRDMMPDYEYMFWTDESSRNFIQESYPWFLITFDSYPYPIQRADAIRYFILYHYGGVYLDLDVACMRPLDHLLPFQVVLPETRPVGISNDIIFSEKGHPFMAQTIHNLVTFDHNWVLNYPTVMFSTGPMFLSAQYSLYTASHPAGSEGEVRVLPISMYGKYAKEGQAADAFFVHLFGSSWHADDAAFIGVLHHHGITILWVGIALLALGVLRMAKKKTKETHYGSGRVGGFDVVLPQWSNHGGRWQMDLGWLSLPSTQPLSPTETSDSAPHSPSHHRSFGSFDSRSSSSDSTNGAKHGSRLPSFVRWARDHVVNVVSPQKQDSQRPSPARRRSSGRGVMFFLPAVFTHPQTDVELSSPAMLRSPRHQPPHFHRSSRGPEKPHRYLDDIEQGNGTFHSSQPPDIPSAGGSSSRPGLASQDSHSVLVDVNANDHNCSTSPRLSTRSPPAYLQH